MEYLTDMAVSSFLIVISFLHFKDLRTSAWESLGQTWTEQLFSLNLSIKYFLKINF